MVGFALFISGQHDQAIEKLKSILEMNPDYSWANSVLGEVYEQKGMYSESFASFKKAIASYGESPSLFMGFLGYAYATGGQREKAVQILNQLRDVASQRYVSPYALGIIHLGLGQKDKAFALFEQAAEERTTMMTSLRFDHRMDSIRSDPRFIALLKKMNLD
jgi:tetratricopeptide (TPR) repeat protein